MTEEKRIRFKIYGLIGTTLVIVIAMSLLWSLLLRRPQLAQIAQTESAKEDKKQAADKLPSDLAEEQKAKDKARYLQGTLEFFRGSDADINRAGRYRRFYFDFGNATDKPDVATAKKRDTWKRLLNERYLNYGEALKQELLRIGNATGVVIKTTVKIDPPPFHPEDITVPTNGFIKPVSGGKLGGVTVQGWLVNILDFLNKVNHSNILLVVGNVKLEGTDDKVKCTFDLYPYELAAGPSAPVSGGGAPAAGAAPGGAAPGGSIPPAGGSGDKKDS